MSNTAEIAPDGKTCKNCKKFQEMTKLKDQREMFAFSIKNCVTCLRNPGRGKNWMGGSLDGIVNQLFGSLKDCWEPIPQDATPEDIDTSKIEQ